jgi:hypothetical protein
MDHPTFLLKGGHYTFTPLGGPIDQEPRHHLFEELGHALASWTRMEHMLTTIALHINKEAASQALYDPDPQSKFSGMIRLLRKWISQHPDYKGISSPDDAKFFEVLLEEAKLRNELAHSFLEAIDPETGKFTMCRLRRAGKNTWEPITTTYLPETPAYLGSQATTATRHFVEIAKVVFEPADDTDSSPEKP